ncbi:MAG: hypothetical protein M3Y31_08145, partial [Gemmatimonadota bacterium]|nr:hypothetical protein [Gemmatimonadota bacterium]
MHLPGQTYPGAPLDDVAVLDRIPAEYAQLLAQRNGFVAFGGALHVRGACTAPEWHSLRNALDGPDALHRLFPAVDAGDIPFGEDALGNQFILRGGAVHRLAAAAGAVNIVEIITLDITTFLMRCLEEPAALLPLDALAALHAGGGRLSPGELLDMRSGEPRAVPALAHLRSL